MGKAPCWCISAGMRNCHGGRWWARARNCPALRCVGGGDGTQSLDEGGSLHILSYWHGFLGVPRHRGDPHRWVAVVFGVRATWASCSIVLDDSAQSTAVYLSD